MVLSTSTLNKVPFTSISAILENFSLVLIAVYGEFEFFHFDGY